jgi:polysaccharide biosynthesis transport protein
MESSNLTFRPGSDGLTRFVEPLFIYKAWLFSSLTICCLLGWIALLVWPRTYESTGMIQLNVGRETVGLDPSTTASSGSQTLQLQKTQEEDVNSALEILGSRELAEMVVDEIGAEAILDGYLPSNEKGEEPSFFQRTSKTLSNAAEGVVMTALDTSGVRDQITDRERAIIRVQRSVAIHSPKRSTTMVIRTESKSPQMAQAITKSLMAHFFKKYVNVTSTDGSHDFFVAQATAAETRMNDLLGRRSRMLKDHQIASTESKHTSLTSQLATIESTVLNTQAQLKRTDSEIEDISMRMKELEEEIISSKQTSLDPGVSGMRNQLYVAELEEKRQSALYTADHPRLVQIREQIAAGREVLERLKRESESQSTTPNPLRLKLEEELLKAKTSAVGLQALLEESLVQKDEKQREIRELLDFEVDLSEVNREIDVASTSLVSLREKQEQARVVDDLREKRISSVKESQPPSFAEKPSSPKKPLIVLAAIMMGLLGGIGLIGLREYTRKTIRRPDEVERRLGCPVLAGVPENRLLRQVSSGTRKQVYKRLRSGKIEPMYSGCRDIMSELYMGNHHEENQDVPTQGRTIGVVSVSDGCGASSVAMVLALEASENEGLRTTLVDLDLKKRTVSSVFGLTNHRGIVGDTTTPESLHQITRDSLSLVGSTSRNKARRQDGNSASVVAMLRELAQTNDLVIVDLPPANRPSNLIQIAKHLDHVIVVVESETTESRAIEKLLEKFDKQNIEVAGVVVNKMKRRVPAWLEKLLG